MKITNLHRFLHTYFKSHQCEIISDQDGVMTVKLTEEMDKALMNRPFYWHYIKSLGQEGEPMKLTLITNPNKREERGEWIHFGSPRLQQIMQHLRKENPFIKLFQKIETGQNTPLYPWLMVNVKISYQGKQKKEEIYSLGLHLVNGIMKIGMMDLIERYPLSMNIPDYCYPISPIIKVKSGFSRIESVLETYIHNQDHEWAKESLMELDEEIKLVHYFYNNSEEKEEQLEKEINDITERYTPQIIIEVINGGLVYLTNDFQTAN